MPTQSKWQSLPTEAINPVSLAIDKAPVSDIVDMMINEDRKVIAAVQKEKERIAHGVEIITQALRKGGRIVFVGAGTSGRLGVVEAAEMPPTFGTTPKLVQAIMAGGQEAVFRAKEGVEDNYEEGARSISRLRLTQQDVVIGVSASGMTPFVRGALTRARKAGGKIIFVTCWPGSELQNFVDLQIAPAVGPEVIAGSTRLKAGTATKMVLNMLTTIAMIKIGKTYGNLMVDVQTGSEKLKDRARRIIGIVTGLDYDEADELLKRAKWNVKAAIVMQKAALTLPQALRRLKKADDSVREAIGEDIEPGCAQPRSIETPCRSAAAAAASSTISTSGCSCRNDAGSSVVTGPRTSRSTTAAFAVPVATSTIWRACRIVAIPIDSASGGTAAGSPPKSSALPRRVSGSSVTRCVRACSAGAGSLKPMWPLVPMPRICRSMPPAAAIARS